jgi:hypothetical protein
MHTDSTSPPKKSATSFIPKFGLTESVMECRILSLAIKRLSHIGSSGSILYIFMSAGFRQSQYYIALINADMKKPCDKTCFLNSFDTPLNPISLTIERTGLLPCLSVWCWIERSESLLFLQPYIRSCLSSQAGLSTLMLRVHDVIGFFLFNTNSLLDNRSIGSHTRIKQCRQPAWAPTGFSRQLSQQQFVSQVGFFLSGFSIFDVGLEWEPRWQTRQTGTTGKWEVAKAGTNCLE